MQWIQVIVFIGLDGGQCGKGMVKYSKNRFQLRMKPIPISILDKKLT